MIGPDKSMFTVEPLVDLKSVLFYYDLTVIELRPRLWQVLEPVSLEFDSSLKPRKPFVAGTVRAWGVRFENEPVGLLLCSIEFWSEPGEGLSRLQSQRFALEVMSVAVRQPFRRRGLATSLLDAASVWTQQKGLSAILITMPLHQPGTSAIDRLTTSRNGWEDKPGIILATLASCLKVEPLLRRFQRIARRYQIRVGYRITPYPNELIPALKQRVEDPSLPGWAQPADPSTGVFGDAPLDRCHSRLLWRDEKLIGWLVCHRPQQDLLRYTIGWVDAPWQRRGGLFVLLADVIEAAHFQGRPRSNTPDHGADQTQQGMPIARGCFGFKAENYLMLELCTKHFRPCCTHYIEARVRSKRF